jgi:hypothetical protein
MCSCLVTLLVRGSSTAAAAAPAAQDSVCSTDPLGVMHITYLDPGAGIAHQIDVILQMHLLPPAQELRFYRS